MEQACWYPCRRLSASLCTKLIVARHRRQGDPKRDKDLFQAQALLDVLINRRPFELRDAWEEAIGRGNTWKRLLGEGLELLRRATRDGLQQGLAVTN
jgi:hypothetical protein